MNRARGSSAMTLAWSMLRSSCFVSLPSVAREPQAQPQQKYDLLLRGGHVIDPQERDQRRARRGHRGRQGRGGGGQTSIPPRPFKTVDVSRPLRHARADRHPRPRLHRHGRDGLVRRRQQRLPRRLHLPRRRDHGGRRRAARAGATSRTSSTASSTARRRACSPSSTSSATACAAERSSRTSPTWRRSRPPTWRSKHKGVDRRHQDRALRRPRVGAGRAGGGGRHARRTSR